MKKDVRAQLEALANEILQQKELFSTAQLKQKALLLYEQLTVIEYLENQIGNSSNAPSIPSKDSKSYREENWFVDPKPVPAPNHKEDLVEPLIEKIKDLVAQMPEESQRVDELLEEVLPKKSYIKNDLEEFAANYQQTPTFERKTPTTPVEQSIVSTSTTKISEKESISAPNEESKKQKSVNDIASKGLIIGLNDRIAFIKHLFNDSTEDYTRVLSQISTLNSFEDANHFIKVKVKPDYNYWLGKEEYSERFMAIIEKSF